jgi:hypothetical protein
MELYREALGKGEERGENFISFTFVLHFVHHVSAGLFLKKEKVHFFDYICPLIMYLPMTYSP